MYITYQSFDRERKVLIMKILRVMIFGKNRSGRVNENHQSHIDMLVDFYAK